MRYYTGTVETGRPRPWMVMQVMKALDIFPPASVVKVGVTPKDITESKNAGAWTVGVYHTGNNDFDSLREAGANYLIPSVRELPPILSHIENKLIR